MTVLNTRRRMANDDLSPEEVEDLISESAEQRIDEERDRHAEELYKEAP